jgi:peptidoglycan/LPS O-acetylase OafA/YrhL
MRQTPAHDPTHADGGAGSHAGASAHHRRDAGNLHILAPVRRAFRSSGSSTAYRLEGRTPAGAIPALDGVRAIACLSVMGYHLNLITRDMHIWASGRHPLLDSLLLSGNSGVTLFFVLSGFLLFLPYARALLCAQSWPDAREFYLRRALRIIPGYYASLFLIVTLQQPEYLAPSHWRDLLLFLLFLMDSTRATFQHLNGPYWTLAIEWQFYLLLPLIALALRGVTRHMSRRRRVWAVSMCLLALMAWGVLSRLWGPYVTNHPTATVLLPRRALDGVLFFAYGYRGKYLEDFTSGMLAGLCYTVLRDPAGLGLLRRMRRLSPWLGCGAVVALLALDAQLLPHLFPASAPAFIWCGELAFSLSFACGILALLVGTPALRRPFEWAPLRGIGLISYGLYIWHLPLLVVFMHQVGPSLAGLPPAMAYGLYWAWAALVVIPFSAAVYLLIEKPGMRLGERLRSRMFARREPVQSAFASDAPRSEACAARAASPRS